MSADNPYNPPESKLDSPQGKKQFDVYLDNGRIDVVKKGFSWTAFFFGALWAFLNDLYGIGVVLLAITFGAQLLGGIAGLIYMILPIAVGYLGNDWKRSALLNKGYKYIETVYANNVDDALTKSSHLISKTPASDS